MVICKDKSKILNLRRSIVTKHQWTIIPNHSHYKCSVNYKGRTHTHTSKFIGTWPLEYIVLAPFENCPLFHAIQKIPTRNKQNMHANIVSISEKDQEASIQHIWPPRHANPEKTGGQSTRGE